MGAALPDRRLWREELARAAPAGRPSAGRAFYGPLTETECDAPAVLLLAS